MRYSRDEFKDGLLVNGFDYGVQCWVVNGLVLECGHRFDTCGCFGKLYKGLPLTEAKALAQQKVKAVDND